MLRHQPRDIFETRPPVVETTRWASSQFADDISRQMLFDLAMSWNWLRLFSFRIVIPVMPAPMPKSYATHALKLFD